MTTRGPSYEALVKSAIRFNKMPAGKMLVVERGARRGEATIVLTEPHWLSRRVLLIQAA